MVIPLGGARFYALFSYIMTFVSFTAQNTIYQYSFMHDLKILEQEK